MPPGVAVDSRRPTVLAVLALVTLTVPFAIRLANAAHGVPAVTSSYLPALEGPRVRDRFDPTPIDELAGMQPGLVVIGDSMAGTRVDPKRLTELTGMRIAPLLNAGSGSAWWYLVLKNWVIASGIHPRYVLIFFRDTNLTNVMYRLDEQFRWMVDFVAHDREDELNGVLPLPRRGRGIACRWPLTRRTGPAMRAAGWNRGCRTRSAGPSFPATASAPSS